jgi:hypothetical protein
MAGTTDQGGIIGPGQAQSFPLALRLVAEEAPIGEKRLVNIGKVG